MKRTNLFAGDESFNVQGDLETGRRFRRGGRSRHSTSSC